MGKSYNDLQVETMKEQMIKLNQEYEKTKLLMEYEKWESEKLTHMTWVILFGSIVGILILFTAAVCICRCAANKRRARKERAENRRKPDLEAVESEAEDNSSTEQLVGYETKREANLSSVLQNYPSQFPTQIRTYVIWALDMAGQEKKNNIMKIWMIEKKTVIPHHTVLPPGNLKSKWLFTDHAITTVKMLS